MLDLCVSVHQCVCCLHDATHSVTVSGHLFVCLLAPWICQVLVLSFQHQELSNTHASKQAQRHLLVSGTALFLQLYSATPHHTDKELLHENERRRLLQFCKFMIPSVFVTQL